MYCSGLINEKEGHLLNTYFEEDFGKFLWEIGNFIRDKGLQFDPGLYCATTVAVLSLKHTCSDVKTIIESFERDETRSAIMIYVDYYTELQVFAAKYGREVLEYGMKNMDLNEYCNWRKLGDPDNYQYLNNLILGLHHVQSGDLYIEYGCGRGNGIINAASKGITSYGVDINIQHVIVTEIKAFWKKIAITVECVNMDENGTCEYGATKSTVDTGFMRNNYNFDTLMDNKYLQPYKAVIKKAGIRIWGQAIIAYQKNKTGRVIALTFPAALFNNSDKGIRKTLVNQGLIEGIIELPNGTINGTNVKPVVIIISKENYDGVKIMDATDLFKKTGRAVTIEPLQIENIIEMYDQCKDRCRMVSVSEIASCDYVLSANRYFEKNKIVEGIALKDICDIERGTSIRSGELKKMVSEEPTKYQYLMLQDIVDGKIVNQLPYLKEIDRKYSSAILKNEDIVISKLVPFKICLVHIDDEREILANGNLFRITVNKAKMNPIYVMLYLRSQQGQQELARYVNGAVMRAISIKDLKQVKIPRMEMEEQNKMAEKYKQFMVRLEKIDLERERILADISELL